MKRSYFFKTFVMISLISLALKGYPCGVSFWDCCQIRGFFDAVDKQGHVQLTVKLGEITMVQKGALPIPVYALFKSDSANNSPVAGYGWTVPLFESRMYESEAGLFCMVQPDGLSRYFVRDKKNPNFLRGKRPWSATIQGSVITAQCTCKDAGKSVLTFRQGRLASLSVREGRYDFYYTKDALTEIKQGVRSVLKVLFGPKGEKAAALEFSDKRNVSLALVDRPQLRVVKGDVLNVGNVKSLGSVTEGPATRFSAGYGVAETYTPYIRVADRMISWDPLTYAITRDGDWTYRVTPPSRPWNNAAIGRTRATGEYEYIFNDLEKGVETSETIEGLKTITWKFTSGQLQGLIRKVETYQSGTLESSEAYSYDEKGRFRRHRRVTFDTGNPFIVEQFFDEHQRPTSLLKGTNKLEYVYNGSAFKCEAVICNGKILKVNTTNGLALAKAYLEQQKK